MKLSSDSETLAENKVVILYLLNKVSKELTNDALFQLVYSITDMNYFYFQQFLLDLLETNYISNYIKGTESVYEITKKGKEALIQTESLIPGILKLRIDNNFKENLDTIEEEYSVTTEFIPEPNDNYSVKCKIIENNKVIFEIQVYAGSQEQSKKVAENWKHNAIELYPKLLEILENR